MYRDWLYNRRSEKTRKKKASKLGQKWTSRMVIEQLRKEEIIEKTGAMPGSKTFIERYQTTLTAVMAGLSKEELEEAQNTAVRDRKSTRLNSSHQIISYAVFCLKKKK